MVEQPGDNIQTDFCTQLWPKVAVLQDQLFVQ